jgi:hypothetical protein
MFAQGNISPERRVQQAHYAARKCRRAGHVEAAEGIVREAKEVMHRQRTLVDLLIVVYAAVADRDMADDTLDGGAQALRLGLGSRALDATTQAPYTLIFPKGIKYYTAASVRDQEERYLELRGRVERFLPEDDPLRAPALATIDAGLAAWAEGTRGLSDARREAALASAELETAEEALDTLLERVFGLLVQAHGRRAARRFFPKADRALLKKADLEEDDEVLPTE